MLFKVREFININILKSIYYAIFDCHLNYANTVLGQNRNSINRLIILQKKISALWVLNAEMLIQILFIFRHEIIKLPDKILLISKPANFNFPSIFNHLLTFSSDCNNYETYRSLKGLLKVKTVNTKKYGRKAMINNAISS